MPYGLEYENSIDFTLAQHEILKQSLLISPHMAKFIDVPAAWAGVRYRGKRMWGTGWRRFFGNITAISTGIWVKLHLHWAKANSQANSFLTSSIWTLNWILYPPIWKGCRFWANTQWKKSTGFWLFVMLFSPPHFQFKSVNISTILTSKLKRVCIWVLVSWLSLGIYIPWVESSVNKQIHLICVLFLDRTMRRNPRKYWYVMALPSTCKKSLTSDWLANSFRRDF